MKPITPGPKFKLSPKMGSTTDCGAQDTADSPRWSSRGSESRTNNSQASTPENPQGMGDKTVKCTGLLVYNSRGKEVTLMPDLVLRS